MLTIENQSQLKGRINDQGILVYDAPIEVFKDEIDREDHGFPREKCRYIPFGTSKKALVGFAEIPDLEVAKYLWNCLDNQHRQEYRNSRCMIQGKSGKLIRCPDGKKCSKCPYCNYRQPRVIEYGEPEELNGYDAAGMDDFEKEMDLNTILKAINKKDPQIGKVFDLCSRYGYSAAEIAEIENITERRVRYLLDQAKEIGIKVMSR